MMATSKRHTYLWNIKRSFKKYWPLYICLLLVLTYYVIFHYAPMMGIQIAFKDYSPSKGIWQSPWVGLKHFKRFFNTFDFTRILKNTVFISLYKLAVGFPIPILLAIMLNELRSKAFQKTIQMVTYAPHFLSLVVVAGLTISFLSPSTGIVNKLVTALGGQNVNYMAEPSYFRSIFVITGVWQNCGWNSVIYIATIAGIDPALYEAAVVDGASKLKRIIYITLPMLLPTITILFIMNSGRIMQVGYEKVLLLQNSLNLNTSEVISTYVYKNGLLKSKFSFSTAVGLFNSAINFTLLVLVNGISRRMSGNSLW